MIGPETEKSYGYEPAHGFGCGQTLDTDRLLGVDRHFGYGQTLGCGQTFQIHIDSRTWTDISYTYLDSWMWTDISDTDSGCGQTFGLRRVSLPFPCLFLLFAFVL